MFCTIQLYIIKSLKVKIDIDEDTINERFRKYYFILFLFYFFYFISFLTIKVELKSASKILNRFTAFFTYFT